ncbi:MAG: hypothetical protein ACREBF_02100 [Candidatus Micrarchaeales archaeon]
MFAKHHYILLGIIALCLSYVMFTGEQYFSEAATAVLFVLAILAAILFFIPHLYPHKIKSPKVFFFLLALIVILGAYEFAFNLVPSGALLHIGYEAILLAISSAISIYGIYKLEKLLRKAKGSSYIAYAFLGLLLISFLAYAIMYIVNTVQWQGVDEVAFNYYAAYLFVHGQNPYATSMLPILNQYHVQPTVLLNGGYELSYDYPALSFLAFIFLPLLGITNLLSFTYLTILFTVIAAFVLYRKSENNKNLLIPLAGWFIATYALVGVASQYLAVPIFLLFAYLYKNKPLISGVLLGLGASVIQLTWFAIPFFLVLMYKEKGRIAVAHGAIAALAVFVAINGAFVLSDPGAIGNILGLFGLSKLPFYGTNIMQFVVAWYPLPYWYSAFISAATFVVLLTLYYFYTKTLKPLIAIVPMMIFFMSWRNITIYGLPFIAILLAVYFWRDHHQYKNNAKKKIRIIYALATLFVFGIIVAIAAHQSYVSQQSISISKTIPILSVQNNYYGTSFGMLGIRAIVNNTFNRTENVSFFVLSRAPNNEQYFLSSSLNQSIGPHSSANYTLQYSLPRINNNTQLMLFAFSQDYISSKKINFTTLGSAVSFPSNTPSQTH